MNIPNSTYRLMITCPTTQQSVFIGIEMTGGTFRGSGSTRCRACGEMHEYTEETVHLELSE